MAKFCRICGAPCEAGKDFCPQCGTPVTPTKGRPAPQGLFGFVKKNIQLITLITALWGFLVAVLNLFGLYEVKMTVGSLGSVNIGLGEIRADESGELALYCLSGYLVGFVGLALFGLMGWSAFLRFQRRKGARRFFRYGILVSLIGGALAVVLALIGGRTGGSIPATLGIHFTYWLTLILGIFLFYTDRGLSKKKHRVVK